MKTLYSTLLLLVVASLFFLNCNKENEFDITTLKAKLSADFTVDSPKLFINESIKFKNSSNSASSYLWTFEGGKPTTSTEKEPIVQYSQKGKFTVELKSMNEKGDVVIEKKDEFITVYSKESWSQFIYPKIDFQNQSLSGNGALYAELIPDPESLIHSVCFDVCNILFKDIDEIDVLKMISYTIEDTDGISAKGGMPPHISIFFSSRYLEIKKKEGLNNEELIAEIKGVLYHEITHGYQYSPIGAGDYQGGTDFFGFIEGMADYVRYVSGYGTTNDRHVGGNWKDGYKTSAFFIDWLHSKDKDFIYKLNQTAKTINPWSWELAVKEILDASVSSLWEEYQNDIKTGKIIEVDQQLKDLRRK